jgi:hypothetical protein
MLTKQSALLHGGTSSVIGTVVRAPALAVAVIVRHMTHRPHVRGIEAAPLVYGSASHDIIHVLQITHGVPHFGLVWPCRHVMQSTCLAFKMNNTLHGHTQIRFLYCPSNSKGRSAYIVDVEPAGTTGPELPLHITQDAATRSHPTHTILVKAILGSCLACMAQSHVVVHLQVCVSQVL